MQATKQHLAEFKHARLWYNEPYCALIVQASSQYLPMAEFVELFHKAEDYVRQYAVKKLIFDKTHMKVFHQPSIIWYHVYWKVEMAGLGLKKHRIILPDDRLFKEAIHLVKKKIIAEYPQFHLEDYDIKYVETLDQGLRE